MVTRRSFLSKAQSTHKLIIFLDLKLKRANLQITELDLRLDSQNFWGSRIKSQVEFCDSPVTVNLPLSGMKLEDTYVDTPNLVNELNKMIWNVN